MTRLILIQDTDFERQYQESLRYLDGKYPDTPMRSQDTPLTRAQQLTLTTHGRYNQYAPNQSQQRITGRTVW